MGVRVGALCEGVENWKSQRALARARASSQLYKSSPFPADKFRSFSHSPLFDLRPTSTTASCPPPSQIREAILSALRISVGSSTSADIALFRSLVR